MTRRIGGGLVVDPASRSIGDPCICGDKTTWHRDCYSRIRPGFKVRDAHGEARFLADVADQKYVVLRRKGAIPFIVSMRDYFKKWTPA